MKTPTNECDSGTAKACLAFAESVPLSPQHASPGENVGSPLPSSTLNSDSEGLVVACWWLLSAATGLNLVRSRMKSNCSSRTEVTCRA